MGMLVLSRRDGESIIIGDDITITVISSIKGQSKIGIDAPRNISVHREEVYNRIQRNINNGVNEEEEIDE